MCGIAGVMGAPGATPASVAELRRMLAVLAHRGPDGYGIYRDEHVGLAHVRLSLIDLAGSAQPLSNQAGTIWLSFNGEIFNFIELREQLRALGHRFSTSGDGEVIIHCYERYGARAWAMLNGQFAFALWDTRRRQLWLVRDRLGILPLYYSEVPGHLIFASEAKALFAGGRLAPEFDPAGLSQVFTTWYAKAPRSAFSGIRQVAPATALCFDETLCPRAERYWQPRSIGQSSRRSSQEVADALEARLQRAVALRLRADVPVGAYVSGGLDSSVIGSLAAAGESRLETFGIRFEDARFDETAPQHLVAAHLGTNHHEFVCTAALIRENLPEVVWHCETPLLRTSPVPLFLLSRMVNAAGIKTVMTGEGADELLCGYTIFKEDQIRRFWARQPQSEARPKLLQRLYHYVGDAEARQNPLWQDFFRRGLQETDHPFYSHLIRWQNTAWTLRLLAPDIRASLPFEAMLAEMETDLPEGWHEWDPLTRTQYIEIDGFLSSYLLPCQGDRVAMAHGVEARYPFLDPDLVDFSFTLRASEKLLGTRDKLPLRRLARRYLPAEIWERRKQPFRAPIATALLAAGGADDFADILSPASLAECGLFDVPAATRLVARLRARGERLVGEREEMGLVGILTLQLLANAFCRSLPERVKHAELLLKQAQCNVMVDRLEVA